MSTNLTRRHLIGAAATATGLLLLPAAPAAAEALSGGWRDRLRRLERSHRGRIGAFAIDTATGATAGYRAGERFPLLSTFKAFAAGAILHRARTTRPGLLGERVRWSRSDLVAHSPVTAEHVADGLTVAELCHAAITQSDNTAANLLLKRIGGPAGLTRFLRGIGDRVTRLDRWETDLNDWAPGRRRDTTTPAAAARSLRALTTGRALHPADRTRLIGWMRQTATGDNRIRAGLPATWKVGDKTGSSPRFACANDIAIAHPPAAPPLIIAVYTHRDAPGAATDESVIARTATILVQALGRRI